ncbi:MAG: hypothetical protein KKB59_06885, partial [Spirochaetes bacterium]|nr:hypothetical protein [Spirochaetota bacterium]
MSETATMDRDYARSCDYARSGDHAPARDYAWTGGEHKAAEQDGAAGMPHSFRLAIAASLAVVVIAGIF